MKGKVRFHRFKCGCEERLAKVEGLCSGWQDDFSAQARGLRQMDLMVDFKGLLFCLTASWGKPVLMLKKRADAQEIRALFTALLQIFIQGLWQMFKPGQLLWWDIW